jgi:hypothetical protein
MIFHTFNDNKLITKLVVLIIDINKYLSTRMSLIDGRIVGLTYESYPVFLAGDNQDMFESFVPTERGQQERSLSWDDMKYVLMGRSIIRNGSIGKFIKEEDMNQFIKEMQLEQEVSSLVSFTLSMV